MKSVQQNIKNTRKLNISKQMEEARPAFWWFFFFVDLFDSFSQICTFSYIHINIYYDLYSI